MKTRLNLATDRFPRYRKTNLFLFSILVAALLAGVWLVSQFVLNPPDVASLASNEQQLRTEWEDLGQRVAAVEDRLGQPEASAQLSELTFLSQVMARKQFSWTHVLREIERVIPTGVYLAGLAPEIQEDGGVFLQMEARGRTIDDLSEFIGSLEMTDAFRDVKVAQEEQAIIDGRNEVRIIMGADYVGATLTEVEMPGD